MPGLARKIVRSCEKRNDFFLKWRLNSSECKSCVRERKENRSSMRMQLTAFNSFAYSNMRSWTLIGKMRNQEVVL